MKSIFAIARGSGIFVIVVVYSIGLLDEATVPAPWRDARGGAARR
jgi:hypothetical protein